MTGGITPEQAAKLEALIAQMIDREIGVPVCPTAEDVERALQRATGTAEPIEVSDVRIEGDNVCFTLMLPRWVIESIDLGGT